MQNMVYQGTVLGPMLWNLFFQDAALAIRSLNFSESIYADDLNAMRRYASNLQDDFIMEDLRQVQRRLHQWGDANGVQVDASKESLHILSRSASGDNFKILGIRFDPGLKMHGAIYECAMTCNWKLQSVLRTRRFFTDREIIQFF